MYDDTMSVIEKLRYRIGLDPNPNNYGYHLEIELMQRLLAELPNHVREIQTESDLVKRFGWDATSIDFCLETMSSSLILIQTKWRKTRRKETVYVNNFLRSLDYMKRTTAKPISFCLWVTRIEPFQDLIASLEEKNVYVISAYHSIDELVNKTMEFIKSRV